MTKPVHTVSYMKAVYRKYQIITLVCALLTIAATLFAAVSGIQISDLRKQENKAAEVVPAPAPVQPDFALERELATVKDLLADTQKQLSIERENVRRLGQKIAELEKVPPASAATPALQEEKRLSITLPAATASKSAAVQHSAAPVAREVSPPPASGTKLPSTHVTGGQMTMPNTSGQENTAIKVVPPRQDGIENGTVLQADVKVDPIQPEAQDAASQSAAGLNQKSSDAVEPPSSQKMPEAAPVTKETLPATGAAATSPAPLEKSLQLRENSPPVQPQKPAENKSQVEETTIVVPSR